MITPITKTFTIGGQEVTLETGRLAKQAHGSVVLTVGKMMLLATIVSDQDAGEGVDFLPLTVNYKEKYAAAGKFPGGFFKREARTTDYEVLICRIVDRAIRPLFPDDYHSNTMVDISLISADLEHLPDAYVGLAASAAIAVSDIPFAGPLSECRVAKIDGNLVINPSIADMENASLELMVGATEKDINMVEGEAHEASEAEIVEALKFAHDEIKNHCRMQNELAEAAGRTEIREYSHEDSDPELEKAIREATYDKVLAAARMRSNNKKERKEAFKAIIEEYVATLPEEEAAEKSFLIGKYYHDVEKDAIREMVLEDRLRLDGRQLDEIRDIWSMVDYLPSAHGSAVFTRGETQSLTTVTLGTKLDEQTIDGAVVSGSSKFLLHYNFPAFSTGEARPSRGPGRREIGHGNLALRALKNMVPSPEEGNPYTIRIVSDILESNGSSSMATVCAGTLAMQDAGVGLKKPVSGIAMGLISDEESGKYAVLSDILGDEDHLGDMDFKVTGTKDGITACQMDIKVNGLSYDVLTEALEQARQGRLHILGKMSETISEPREDYKPHAPRIVQIIIPKDLIGTVIGPGGKVIQEIQATTETTISITEEGDKGIVQIASDNKAGIDGALAKIKALTAQAEVGEVYDATVKSIMPYGAFVEFLPGKEGLLHISEIANERIASMDGVFKVGEKIQVKLLDVDQRTGKYKLSRKVLLPKEENV